MNIQEIRNQYPQYSNVSDEKLAQGLYNKFYKDKMDYNSFSQKIGLQPQVQAQVQQPVQPAQPQQPVDMGVKSGLQIAGETARDVLRQGAGYLTGGLADEAEAGIRAAFSPRTYSEIKEDINKQQDIAKLRQGGSSGVLETVGQIGGALSPMSLVGKTGTLGKVGRTIASPFGVGKAAQAAEGAIYGAAEGRTPEERLIGAATGAGTSLALGAAGRGITKSLQKVRNPFKDDIAKIASNKKLSHIAKKGIEADPKMASKIAGLTEDSIEKNADRTRSILAREMGADDINRGVQQAKEQYSNFMERNKSSNIKPTEKMYNIFDKKSFQSVYNDVVADNPELRSLPQNSVQVLQEVKSEMASRGRRPIEKADTYKKIASELTDEINKGFSGYKEMNKLYAKSKGLENILNESMDLKGKETKNFAESLITEQNKSIFNDAFGSDKASKIRKALKRESNLTESLKDLNRDAMKKSREKTSLRDVLNRARHGLVAGAAATSAATGNIPAAAGLIGGDILATQTEKKIASKRLKNILEKSTRGKITKQQGRLVQALSNIPARTQGE